MTRGVTGWAALVACLLLFVVLPPSALAAAPANDNFAAADLVTGSAATATGTNVEATKEIGEPNHAGTTGGRSVWYRWVAPFTGTATIDTAGSNFDTVLGVYTGATVDGLTVVASNDQAIGSQSRVRFSAVEGRTYMIAVDGYYGSTGSVTLHVALATAPANDNFASAEVLAGDSASASADTSAATREPGEPSHGAYGGASVWYSWTAPSTGGVTVSSESSAVTAAVGVYTGSSVSALTGVVSGSHPYGRTTFRAVEGTTYHIAVDAYSASQLGGVTVSLALRPLPDNDMFATATALGGDANVAVTGRNDGASVEPGEPNPYGYYEPVRNSVWYSWTAPKSGSLTIKSTAGFSTAVAAYTGDSVSGLSRLTNQAQASCGCGYGQIRLRVEAGVTYRIAVTSYSADVSGDFTLALDLIDSPPNDDFANGTPIVGLSADVDGTNVGATQEPGEPVHDDNYYDPSVWYTWTAPATGGVTLDMAGSSLNSVVAAYVGDSVSQLTRVATTRVSGTTRPKRRFRAVAGTTYHIAVDGASAAQGTFHLALRHTPPPANDMFDAAEPLSGSSATASGNNLGAAREYGEPGTRDATVWYSWAAPSTGVANVTLPSADFAAGVAAYTGVNVESLTAAPNSTWDSYTRTLRFRATAGTIYRIAVDGGSLPSRGEFTLALEHKQSPPNDDFAGAQALSGTSATATGDFAAATLEAGEPHHGSAYGGRSLWYSWTAPSSGSVSLRTSGSPYTPGLAIYTGSGVTSLVKVASNYDGSDRTLVRFRAVAGATYRIAIENYYTSSGAMTAQLSLQLAPLPANDMFADATALPGSASVSVSGRNDGASAEAGEPSHYGYRTPGTTVWYSWVAPKSGSLTIKAAGSASPVLAAYTGGTVNSLGRVTNQAQPCCTGAGEIRIRVTTGVTYRIVVDSDPYYAPGGGDFTLGLTLVDMPPNDDFVNAQAVVGVSVDVDGTNIGATQEAGEPIHDDNYYDPSVWYTWTAPSTGGATIDMTGSSLNAVVGVYTGDSVGALTRVTTTRSSGTVRAKRRFRAVAGVTYRIAVDGANAAQGTFHLALRLIAPPANDLFAAAEPLAGLSATATGNNVGATGEPAEPNPGGTAGASVWYSWTAPVTGAATVKTQGADFPATVAVYTGSGVGSLTPVPVGYHYSGDPLRFRAEQGVTYRIAVHGGTAPSRGEFTLRLDEVAAPVNDDFANAELLSGQRDSRTGTTAGATHELNESTFSGGDASIWYRWTAPVNGRVTLDLSGTSFYSTIGVFTGSSVGGLTYVSRTWGKYLTFKAAAGTTYRIVVDGEYGANGPVKLALSEAEAPANDDFANATQLAGSADGASGTNVNGGRESYEPYVANQYVYASVWYRWRAPASGPVTVDTAGSAIDTLLGAYTGGSLSSLTEVASNDDADGTTQSRVTFNATAGTVYRFQVDGRSSMQGPISIHLRHASSPPNDAFADAVELSGEHADANGTNVGATRQTGEPQHGGNAGGASVWYAWTAPADGTLDVAVTPSGFSALVGVYRGDALDSLASAGSGAVDVTGGTTYRIAVDGANDGQGPGEGTFALALDFTAGQSGDAPLAEQLTQPAGPGAGEQQDDPPRTELQQQQEEPPTEPEQQQSEPPVSEEQQSDPQGAEQEQEDPPVIEEQRQEDPPVVEEQPSDPPSTEQQQDPPVIERQEQEQPPTAGTEQQQEQPPTTGTEQQQEQPPTTGTEQHADPPTTQPEQTQPPATRPPSGGGAPVTQGSGGTAPAPAALLKSVSIKSQRIGKVTKRGLVASFQCSRACSVSGAVTLGGKRLTPAHVATASADGKRARIVLRLTRAAQRKLKRMRSARVTVTLRASGGGKTATATRRVKLRR